MRALIVVASLALAACGEETSVTMSWRFSGAACDAAGVQTVHVFIGPLAPTGSYDHELQCAIGERGARLEGVAAGPHVLVLKGLAHDHVVYTLTQDLTVSGGGGGIGTFDLTPYTPP